MKSFYKSHGITQGEKVWLIGKGNYFEIIMDRATYDAVQKKSQEAVLRFEQELLGKL
jgi:DNA-binding transcriptional regulator/RsmH inhibitor MraZ